MAQGQEDLCLSLSSYLLLRLRAKKWRMEVRRKDKKNDGLIGCLLSSCHSAVLIPIKLYHQKKSSCRAKPWSSIKNYYPGFGELGFMRMLGIQGMRWVELRAKFQFLISKFSFPHPHASFFFQKFRKSVWFCSEIKMDPMQALKN